MSRQDKPLDSNSSSQKPDARARGGVSHSRTGAAPAASPKLDRGETVSEGPGYQNQHPTDSLFNQGPLSGALGLEDPMRQEMALLRVDLPSRRHSPAEFQTLLVGGLRSRRIRPHGEG